MDKTDLERCYYQFKQHQEVGHLNLKIWRKIILSVLFFVLLLTSMFSIFLRKKKKSKEIFVLEYTNTQPYKTIYSELRKVNKFTLIQMKERNFPTLPLIFFLDVGKMLKKEPLFFVKNLYFFGALALKVSKYHTFIEQNGIKNLVVLQEYSFYSSYLTRILEKKGGKLYNIQHGIPGDTYCFFRFSKCFIWGEYFKQTYIRNAAEPSQFVITGSVFHTAMAESYLDVIEDIDILYVMQGYVGSKEDTLIILEVLNELSLVYKVQILQHPRHKIKVKYGLKECDAEIIEALKRSKVVVSRYSTALLDAAYLGKPALAFIGDNVRLKKYLSYINKKSTITDKNVLKQVIELRLQEKESNGLSQTYIDRSKNPVEEIFNECYKNVNL